MFSESGLLGRTSRTCFALAAMGFCGADTVCGASFQSDRTATVTPGRQSTAAATVEEAASVIDLREISLPDDAKPVNTRQVGAAVYEASDSAPNILRYHQAQLKKLGWTELPGTSSEEQYANAMFSRDGYTLSISASQLSRPDGKSGAYVSIINFGNVSLKSLPVPKSAKSEFVSEATAMYSTGDSVAAAAEQVRKLLQDSGWEMYGEDPESAAMRRFSVKRNAIQVSVMVSESPAQGGRTSLMFSALLLAADIPAPADAKQLSFDGHNKTLRFQTSAEFEAVSSFYEKRLPSLGWKSTTEELVRVSGRFNRPTGLRVYRNSNGDLLELNLERLDELTSVRAVHLTKAEFDAAEAASRQAAEKKVAADRANQKSLEKAKADAAAKTAKSNADIDALANELIKEALKSARP